MTETTTTTIDRTRDAVKAIVTLARRKRQLTADDVIKEMDHTLTIGPTESTRFLATVLPATAAAGKIITKTNRVKRSTRTGGPLTVWKSLLFKR